MLKSAAYNLVVNPLTAACMTTYSNDDSALDVWKIVAIDTLFRIAISHTLSALSMTPGKPKTVGNLIFLCSTLITQPLSAKIAKRYFGARKPPYLHTLAYIFFGWKVNLMVKDVVYCLKGS